ncbi:MAG: hypothetical protein R3F11_18010 [Verrucomicrobiales bacterium]
MKDGVFLEPVPELDSKQSGDILLLLSDDKEFYFDKEVTADSPKGK